MKHYLVPALAALAISLTPVLAQTTQTQEETNVTMEALAKVNSAAEFVPLVAASDMFEIESSRIAEQKAGTDQAKQLAQMLIQDHSKASAELMQLAQQAGLQAQPPAKLDPRHQKMLDQLKQADGKEFDKLYGQIQTRAHQEAIALFTAYSQNGDNEAIKGFAAKGLPKLKEHLTVAEKIQQSQG
jgi:putative membrane protein